MSRPIVMTRKDVEKLALNAGPDSPLHQLAKRRAPTAGDEADDQAGLLEILVGPALKGQPRQHGAGMTVRFPELYLIYAINPNRGGQSSRAARGMAKAMGQLADLPDLHLPVARGPFIGLYLELKRVGEYGRPGQRRMAELLREQGHCVVECQGVEEGLAVVVGYLELPKNRPSARAVCGPGIDPSMSLDFRIAKWRDRAYLILKPVRK